MQAKLWEMGAAYEPEEDDPIHDVLVS
jgi:hypothetical protein